jgi:ABC-type lipoprotein export system ATPase subunit
LSNDITPAKEPSVLLDVRGLGKGYGGAPVLVACDLQLKAGETLAVVGPSGCGKSTLLACIGGLELPDAGAVLIDGRDIASLDDNARARLRAETIGMVFQDHHLLPQLSALENVLLPTLALANQGMTRAAGVERALGLLAQVQLADKRDRRPAELSGGERQRVAVARALVNSPRLLLADEPTGALDQRMAEQLTDLLLKLNRSHRTALVLVTHAAPLAAHMDRTVTLVGGRLQAVAAP